MKGVCLHFEPQHLDQRVFGHRRDNMQRRDESWPEIRTVWGNRDTFGAAKLNYLKHFADAADLGDARLRDVDRLRFDQRLKSEHASHILARRNRNSVLSNAGETVAILRWKYRLFEPSQSVVAQCIRHLDGILHRPGAIDVEHDASVADAWRVLRG